jgi:hypothetical protein
MRLQLTLIFLLLVSSFSYSQKLTGIWRGTFTQRGAFNLVTGQFSEDKYKYEIQIHQLDDKSIEGVTYSYKSTVFYGKSAFRGLYTKQSNNIVVKETKMIELKVSDNATPCLMTCYLDYSKDGSKEILSGTFTSQSPEDKRGCGDGTIRLVRVLESDFKKEDFLTRKKSNSSNSQSKSNAVIAPRTSVDNKPHKPIPVKPGAESFFVKKDTVKPKTIKAPAEQPKNVEPPVVIKKITEVPKVLKERENKLANTIIVDEKDIRIDYYDNGEIDNDTITVYHDNQMVINHGRLSEAPLTLRIHLDETNPIHEIITVANNLGDVPPNTALMVITFGKKRYEVFITSDEKKNAKVIIEYRPKGDSKIYRQ